MGTADEAGFFNAAKAMRIWVEVGYSHLFSLFICALLSHFILRPVFLNTFSASMHWSIKFLIFFLAINACVLISSLDDTLINTLVPGANYDSEQGAPETLVNMMRYIPLILWSTFFWGYLRGLRANLERNRRLQLQANLRESQLHSLKQQLNPDFIFDSLTLLTTMIRRDQSAARDIVSGLASLLRYSLYESQQNGTSLEREIEIVKDYLAIKQLAFDNAVHTRWHIAPELLKLQVLPLSLQSMVELALNDHNSPSASDISLEIHAEEDNNRLTPSR